ncbi:YkgJ family cysteine cluster protein [Desulfocastanea catecholica]
MFLDGRTRRCTIYATRPETCRNHPRVGPRPGYCAFGRKMAAWKSSGGPPQG